MTGYRLSLDSIDLPKFDASGALCAQTDPELFFPDKGDHVSALQAKSICNKCWLIEECLTEALQKNIQDGIWGGATYRDRQNILRRIRDRQALIPLAVEVYVNRLAEQFEQLEQEKESRKKREQERRNRSKLARSSK